MIWIFFMALIMACGSKPLPISKAGLGVRDPDEYWVEARAATLVGFHSKANNLAGRPPAIPSFPIPDIPEVLAKQYNTVGPNHDPICRWA